MEDSGPFRNEAAAEHDLLLAQQADGAEGATKVVVVNVGRYAVLRLVDVDNRGVGCLALWKNLPAEQPLYKCYEHWGASAQPLPLR